VAGVVQLPEGTKGPVQLALGLEDQPSFPLAQTLSESDGSFHFKKVPAGSYDLFAAAPANGYGAFASVLGHDAVFGRMRIQAGGQNVTGLVVPLRAARNLKVIAKARDSAAGCPASVTVRATSLEPWAILFDSSVEASVGKEQMLTGLAPGRFRLVASGLGANCYQANDTIVDAGEGNAAQAVLELASGGSIHGAIEQAGAGSVAVLVNARATDGTQTRMAHADASGHFRFEGLPPGRYRIAAFGPLDVSKARWISDKVRGTEVEVAGGGVAEVQLRTERTGGGQ